MKNESRWEERRSSLAAVGACAAALALGGCGSHEPDKQQPDSPVGDAQAKIVTSVTIAGGSVMDADISANNPTMNYGAATVAQTGTATAAAPLGAGDHEMVLAFNVGGVEPANTVVQTATLNLYYQATANAQIQVFPLGATNPDPWTQAGVTWNVVDPPAQNLAAVGAFNVFSGGGFSSVAVPLGTLPGSNPPVNVVQSWINNPASNNGIYLEQAANTGYTQFATTNNATMADWPTLTLGFACEPGWAWCSGPASAGCLTNTLTDPNNCGGCGGAGGQVCALAGPCEVNVCNNGACGTAPAAAGTACNDQNLCTQTDKCDGNGNCVGSNPVVCTAGQCQAPGTCNPATGACSAPTAAFNGAACDDGNPCTTGDTCAAGACVGIGGFAVPTLWRAEVDGQAGKTVTGTGVAVDPATGDAVVVGQFQGTVDLGAGPVAALSATDDFVVKRAPTTGDASPPAQTSYLWSRHFPAAAGYSTPSVAVDASGNVVVAGSFAGAVSFGGNQELTAAGPGDLFVAKYDKSGNWLWSQHFGVGSASVYSQSVAFDPSGDVVLAGTYAGTLNFGGGNLAAGGAESVFVAKLGAAGGYLAATGGIGAASYAWGVAVDPTGTAVAVAGTAGAGTTSFGASPGCQIAGSSSGTAYVALLGLSNLGCLWAQGFTGTAAEEGRAVGFDGAGNVYVAGSFQGTMNMGFGQELVSAGGWDAFAAGIQWNAAPPAGTVTQVLDWAKGYGDATDQRAFALAVDAAGNVDVGGLFNGSISFEGPVSQNVAVLTSLGGADGFVAQIGPSGNGIWALPQGGLGADQVNGVAASAATGTLYAASTVNGRTDMTLGPESSLLVAQLGDAACGGGVPATKPYCAGRANGVACDTGNPCAPTGTCSNNACVASAAEIPACGALDGCHAASACNLATGACPSPQVPDGTACDSGDMCYTNASCMGGACYGTEVTCPSGPCYPANPTCSSATGCPAPFPNGTACGQPGFACQNAACVLTQICLAPLGVGDCIAPPSGGAPTGNFGTIPVNGFPGPLALDSRGYMWTLSSGGYNELYLMTHGGVVYSAAAGITPFAIAFDGTNMWIADIGTTSILVTSQNNAPVATANIQVSGLGGPFALATDGSNMWVANGAENTVTRISQQSYSITGVFAAEGEEPVAMAFDGTNVWVVNEGGNNVTKLSTAGALLGTFPVGQQPNAIAYDGVNMWVTNYTDGTVTKLSSSGAVLGTFAAGNHPYSIAFDGTYMWIASSGNGTVIKLSLSGTQMASIPVPQPYALAFDGTYMWVSNFTAGTVTLL